MHLIIIYMFIYALMFSVMHAVIGCLSEGCRERRHAAGLLSQTQTITLQSN